MSEAPFDCDIAIAGGGPVGLALAGWLARRGATRDLSVVLIDAGTRSTARDDPRFLALSYGSRMLLETIPAMQWPAAATPIERIHVSQRGHFGRATIERDEHGVPALGYVIRHGVLLNALQHTLDATLAASGTHLRYLENTEALPAAQDADGVNVPLRPAGNVDATPTLLRTRLLIHAEGGVFTRIDADTPPPTAAAGTALRDYRQTALVSTVSVAVPQPNVAWERFTTEGPLALLPIGHAARLPRSGNAGLSGPAGAPGAAKPFDYALVWCCRPESAQRRMQMSDAELLNELNLAFGLRLGHFTRIGPRVEFALGLKTREALVEGRIAAIGNAAQTLHPVAGQGLNLGLRDAHSLVAALAQHGPSDAALNAFARERRLDRNLTIGVTDLLARGFAVDFSPLATLRGFALAALEFVPPVKTAIARQMMFGQRR